MQTVDKRDRRFPNHPTSIGKTLNAIKGPRLDLLEKAGWFGDFPTDHGVKALALAGKVNETKNKQTLTDLRSETPKGYSTPFLCFPPKLFPNPKLALPNRHLHLVNRLSPSAIQFLKDKNRYVERAGGGWYHHELMRSCLMWEFYLAHERKRENTFIPHHRITALDPVPQEKLVTFTHDSKEISIALRWDDDFILDFDARQRLFFLEADKGNEVNMTEDMRRKSELRSFLQYQQFIGRGIYREHFKTEKAAIVLHVFNNRQKMENVMALHEKWTKGNGSNFHAYRLDERFADPDFVAPKVSYANYFEPWQQINRPPLYIDRP